MGYCLPEEFWRNCGSKSSLAWLGLHRYGACLRKYLAGESLLQEVNPIKGQRLGKVGKRFQNAGIPNAFSPKPLSIYSRKMRDVVPLEYWETCDARQGGLINQIRESGLCIRSPISKQIGAELRRVTMVGDDYDDIDDVFN